MQHSRGISMEHKICQAWMIGVAFSLLASAALAQDPFVNEAKAYVATISKPNPKWDGPTVGPIAQRKKSVIYVSADQNNGGARGVGIAAEEAAKAIGWNFRLIDGQGSVTGRTSALKQAASLKPDGIILGTIDAKEQATTLKEIADQGIKIVGWHSLDKPGVAPNYPIFTTITTSPMDIGKAAAMYAVADSNGTAGVVIFNDSAYVIATTKMNAMVEVLRKCVGCSILAVKDVSLEGVASHMPQQTALLLRRYGGRWTHSIGINDLYFDFMSSSLIAALIPGNGHPKNISAGDGSESAFKRIRQVHYQVGTVAEPLRVHGWQAIDELNRAFAGAPPSGYSTPVHMVTATNIKFDGGSSNKFDPDNGYRDIYKKIWGVK
jgi:ribose transport system substrate-binding protein